MSEYRRIQNIDRFVVETFKNCARKVLVWIDNKRNRPGLTGNCARPTEYNDPVTGTARRILEDLGLRPDGRYKVAHIDVPPIGAQCQALDPFRTVNSAVGPLIRDFRMQMWVA